MKMYIVILSESPRLSKTRVKTYQVD